MPLPMPTTPRATSYPSSPPRGRVPSSTPSTGSTSSELQAPPNRTLEPTLAGWREVIATNSELDELSADERAELCDAMPRIEALVREFWGTGCPDTLGHGDLHTGNLAIDGGRLRIFDWTDGCVTHPFLDGTHLALWLRRGDDEADREHLLRDVVAPWRDAVPAADLDRAVTLAPMVDSVFQTVTFDAIARSGEPGTEEFAGVVVMLVRRVLADARAARS